MVEYEKTILGKYASIIMGQSPESKYYNSEKNGLAFIQGNRTFGIKIPTIDTYTTSIAKLGKKGNVIMSVRAPVGDVNLLREDVCLGRGVCALSSSDENNEFLYYLMKYVSNDLVNMETGSVFGSVNKDTLEKLPILLPQKHVRNAIGHILCSIDALILKNNQINDYLIGIARSLYGDYLTSEDYQLMSLSNCASINTDTLGEKHIPSHINYLDTGNICDGHVISYQLLSSKNIIPSRARRIVKQRDIVYSTVRPNQKHFGLLVSIPENCIVSTGFSVIRSNDPHISNEMLYLELTSSGTVDYLQSIAESSTSTYPSIKADDLGEIEVPVGKNSDKLIDTLKKIFDAVNNNDCMNEKLKDIRDILLPKMMSGEIDISKLDLSS